MNEDSRTSCIWQEILTSLSGDRLPHLEEADCAYEGNQFTTSSSGSLNTSIRCLRIRVIEHTDSRATVSWHDPTSCHYDDQHWRRARARHAGVCALSGATVSRGEDIFQPSRRRPPPANAGAMILASALPLCADEDQGDEQPSD
ncbi:DUF3331 domain-containing protein [Caballeronia terrestris]|jgi:hypothetical protein|uniref:DUF3331 domain-containing protein n=1 Tax=Caballeronia terrestris TaxID=1226301 RepID=UPI000B3E48F0